MACAESPIIYPEGYTLRRFSSLDSTNAEALRSGTTAGSIYIADTQTDGRGRRGRNWYSAVGNLHMTICVAVPGHRLPGQLAFVAGLAIFDTLSSLAPCVPFSLKWPNDVLARGKKISGSLVETGDGHRYAVGMGINLLISPPEDGLRFQSTNLKAESEAEFTPDNVAVSLCINFDEWFRRWVADGFVPLRDVWLASAHLIRDTIGVSMGNGRIDGRFLGVDDEGAIIVETAEGLCHFIAAGDVMLPELD